MLAELVECVKNSWHHCTERAKMHRIVWEKKCRSTGREVDKFVSAFGNTT